MKLVKRIIIIVVYIIMMRFSGIIMIPILGLCFDFKKDIVSINLLLNIFVYLFTVGGYYYIFRRKTKNIIRSCILRKISIINLMLIIVLSITLAFSKVLLVTNFNQFLRGFNILSEYNNAAQSLKESIHNPILILNLIIIAPILEEILFREMIFQDIKKDSNTIMAIVIQALIFAFYHGNVVQGLSTFIGGIVFSIIYLKTTSLIAPILIHSIGNFIGTLGVAYMQNNFSDNITTTICYASTIICIVSFSFIITNNNEQKILR